jgi:hypothetical protein
VALNGFRMRLRTPGRAEADAGRLAGDPFDEVNLREDRQR